MDEHKENNSIEVEGKTVDDAINKGLEKLGISKEEAEIKILDEGASGLFGLMGTKPAKVKIQKRSKTSVDLSEKEILAKEETEKYLNLMYFKNTRVTVGKSGQKSKSSESEDEIKIEISSDDDRDISLLIGRDGKTLSALELIFQTIIVNRIIKQFPTSEHNKPKVNVDVNHYYERKIENAMQEVTNAINIVKKTRKSYKLEPMPSRIRRFIHNELKNNSEIETISEGEGYQRRIIINPRNK